MNTENQIEEFREKMLQQQHQAVVDDLKNSDREAERMALFSLVSKSITRIKEIVEEESIEIMQGDEEGNVCPCCVATSGKEIANVNHLISAFNCLATGGYDDEEEAH